MAGCAFPVALSNDSRNAVHCLCLSQPANVEKAVQALSDNMHIRQHWEVLKHYEEILEVASSRCLFRNFQKVCTFFLFTVPKKECRNKTGVQKKNTEVGICAHSKHAFWYCC